MRATEVVTDGDLRSDRVRGEDAGTIRMRAQAVWLRRWGCVDYCDFLHVEVTPCGYPPVPDIDVGVTHCGYPFAYVRGWVHFRADTGVCPYSFKFPEVGVTPCGYPPAYAVM